MVHYDTPKQARDHAEKSLSRLSEMDLAPYPENFTVWFNYHTGRDEELTEAVEQALKDKKPFDDQRCYQIFDKFYGNREREDALYTTSAHIESAVDRVLKDVHQVTDNAHNYGKLLHGASSELAPDAPVERVNAIVSGILTATRQIEERNRELEVRLNESSDEIVELKANLVKVQAEALSDGLTGVGNRKGFDQKLRDCAAVATEDNTPLCLLLIDIDHFKKFNDKFGHAMGDQVLKLVAKCLTTSIKGRDFAGRYGGEEFAIILPKTPLASGYIVANQIRELIASKQISRKSTGKVLSKVAVSIGVGQFRPGEPLDRLIQRTDAALYQAKGSGRNRVVAEDRAKTLESPVEVG